VKDSVLCADESRILYLSFCVSDLSLGHESTDTILCRVALFPVNVKVLYEESVDASYIPFRQNTSRMPMLQINHASWYLTGSRGGGMLDLQAPRTINSEEVTAQPYTLLSLIYTSVLRR
jgi:hypothetical protein